MTNMEKLLKLKKKYKIYLIEDCAESIGSYYKKIHSGNFGDVAIFSFYGSKTITTGEGGMLCTNNKTLIKKAMKMKLQGIYSNKVSYWHDVIGYNYKMTNICAAIGAGQLERIKSTLKKKRELYQKYRKYLKKLPLKFQQENNSTVNSFWLISALTKNGSTRNKLMKYLKQNGVETRPGFYPVHTMPMYKNKNIPKLPIANKLSNSVICFPSWPEMTNGQLNIICNLIKKFFKKK